MLGAGSGGDEFNIVMNFSDEGANLAFEKAIRNMGKLHPKIALMLELQEGFMAVNEKYAIYADTVSNIHLSDEERRKMSYEELLDLATKNANSPDDVNILTTRHYFYGKRIAKVWIQSRHRKKQKMEDH